MRDEGTGEDNRAIETCLEDEPSRGDAGAGLEAALLRRISTGLVEGEDMVADIQQEVVGREGE